MKKALFLVLLVWLAAGEILGAEQKGPPGTDLPEAKRTVPGLYVTAKEAYQQWKAAPQDVKILDVRTPGEYIFVGHPAMARNVPLLLLQYEWNAQANAPAMKPNPEFVAQVKQRFKKTDTILVICRSGGRSAKAVNTLAKAGFKNVYNVTDGFEGDTVKDRGSLFRGKRMKNGWKNSGCSWTYDLRAELMYLPGKKAEQ